MSRNDAMKAAKAETTRFVVWLQVGNERAEYGSDVTGSSDELYVKWTVFEPGNGKIKKWGTVHNSTYKTGNVGVAVPSSTRRSAVYTEYALKQSAQEAADKILEALEIRMDGLPR